MKKILYILMLALCAPAFSQGYLHQSGQKIVDGDGNNVLLRGLGLGGWMIQEGYMLQTSDFAGSQHEIRAKIKDLIGETNTQAFYKAYRDNGITKRDLDSLKAWGFNSVRLPMHYNLYTLPIEEEPTAGTNTWLDEGFTRTDQLLQWCEANQMYLILDMHATPGGQGKDANISDYDPSKPSLWESAANRQKMIALWRKLAERYKDSKWIGAYDIINEPNWNFTGTNQNGCDEGSNGPLRSLMVDVTKSIREVDTNHMIIIEGNCWGNNYNGIFPLWDDNMALSFHKYWNNNAVGSIQGMLNFRTQYNEPLWLGESGENSNVWFRDAISLVESNNIGWSFWPVKKVESISGIASVAKPAGYDQLLTYWKSGGTAPSQATATAVLMQLAENYKMQNVATKRDVADAMFRQVQTTETIKYKTHNLPGKVYATEYDLGTNGYAYSDADVATYHSDGGSYTNWNQGWAMRNDGVDISACNDASTNGYAVGFIQPAEWLVFTLANATATAYDIDIRYSGNGGTIHFEDETGRISQTIKLTSTGDYNKWATVTITGVILKAGTSKLKAYFDTSGFNLNYLEFKNPTSAQVTALKVIDAATNTLGDKISVVFNKELQAGIDFSQSSLSLKVNGTAVAISSIAATAANAITLKPATAINASDVVTLTYAGTNLVAADASVLAAFTDMPVANRLGTILQIPGNVEAEAFSVNSGLTPETCSDAGGGQDLGYTDAGDYVDYLVNVSQAGNYKIEWRAAGESQTGQVKLQLMNDGATQDIQTVSLPSTGAWQTWKTTTSQAQLPAGRYTMRVLITTSGFNFNWVRFSYMAADDDFDGVPNDTDLCPGTPAGSVVDFKGCTVFTLAADNFTVLASSETCRTANNGSIGVTAAANHNYVATLTGAGYNQSTPFTATTTFGSLQAGSYELCLTLPEAPSYKQCFDLIITEPKDLAALARVSQQERKVAIDLYGGKMYTIILNDITYTTSQNTISLDLNPGINTLVVKADSDCQGIYRQKIVLDDKAIVYPNPVNGSSVTVSVPVSKTQKVSIEILDPLGKRVLAKDYSTQNGTIAVDLTSIAAGVYIMKIVNGAYASNTKIVKE